MSGIVLNGVTKRFGDTWALRPTDLEIKDHEFLVLVGPSGSGKTTLLRLIAGLETVSDGEIFFGDRLVNHVDVGDRDIAMVFQNYGLYPHMSVYRNMAFGLRRRRLDAAAIDEKVQQTARLLGIEPLLDRKPRQLSGGQRQRVALGRAIVRDPAVFLLDEPLSNLDAHLRIQMRAEILKVHRSVTATAVYVTHDQVEAMTMGDRIAVVSDGVLQQLGTPDELYDEPVNRFVAGFIGTPPMGFLTVDRAGADGAELTGPGIAITLTGKQAACLPSGAKQVAVGIRPEHFSLYGRGASFRPIEPIEQSQARVDGIVEVVEPLGSEQHVLVRAGEELVTVRLPREQRLHASDAVRLAADPVKLHLFDVDTGVACR
ncbi:MAG TPA: sn-glycerol-3-phosphate ABC transporter ATP-binding protein UgpC [Streptosporangiaceae bacterium]|jgi:multiple sugar transport system ATP-binding protein